MVLHEGGGGGEWCPDVPTTRVGEGGKGRDDAAGAGRGQAGRHASYPPLLHPCPCVDTRALPARPLACLLDRVPTCVVCLSVRTLPGCDEWMLVFIVLSSLPIL